MKKKLALLFLLFFCALLLFPDKSLKPEKIKPLYFAPPSLIKHFAFGFADLYADILWMRLIQDIDFCSSRKGLPVYDGSIKYQCEQGWSFKMTDAITELAPRFLKPYQISGSIMSIIMGDIAGAKKIYDKGVKNFPNNWKIHFSAAYLYLLELKEEEKAAKLLKKAADLGGPFWLYSLAAKTYSRMGKLLLSKQMLKYAMEKDIKGEYKKALERRLKKVEEQLSQNKAAK